MKVLLQISFLSIFTLGCLSGVSHGASFEKKNMQTVHLQNLSVQVCEPIVVAESAPGEKRWGHHQFPTISRLPDGRLLVTFNAGPDRDDTYGKPGPAYVSADHGLTWENWAVPDPLLTVSHSVISQVYDGQFLCVPISPSLDIKKRKIDLPKASGSMNVYGEVLLYRLSECPTEVQKYMAALPGVRWSPLQGKWQREEIAWDTRQALVRTRKSDYVIPRPYIDNRILRYNGKLYYPDFHLQHLLPGDQHPQNYACWCMVSEDNGRSWQRHGLIAHDSSGEWMMGEPCLLPTSDGNLACIIRSADQRQKPLRISYSSDKGRTWSEPRPIHDFGVMPQAELLGNGIAILAFGRPGVHLLFSPDGTAKTWIGPLSLIHGSKGSIEEHSCGYTRLLPIADNAFLIAYSDFKHTGEDGKVRKAILVQKIMVSLR